MLENYGMVISVGSGSALERDSRSSSCHPGVETVIMESAEGLEEVAVRFTPGEWALMDPGQKAVYEEVSLEINAMVAFLGHLRSRPDLIAFLEGNGEDLFLEGPVVEEGTAGEGPSEVLLERLVAEEWEEGLRNWHEANQEGKTQAPTLREKSSPLEENKHLTQKHKGKRARMSSEAGEALSSRLFLNAFHGIDQAEKSSAHRINLSCKNFSHQEMRVGRRINHAKGTSSTALNCVQNVTEESRAADKRFHHEEKVCKCPDCGKTFSGESDLSQHWITHTGENRKTGMNRHQKDHTREKRYRSFDCDEGFSQSGPRISPETVLSEEKPYQCLECGMTFTLKGNLRRHEKYHTGGKSYQCPECGKSFDRSERLISHRRIHIGERPYQCSECGKGYHAKEGLSRHQRIHARKPPSGETPNVCLTCGKIFRNKSDVIRHQTVHTREKPYMCPDCGKCFSQSGSLATHRRIHTGETPHQCVECGKSFDRSGRLISHRRIHTGERPYHCSKCGKSYYTKYHLSRHQRNHAKKPPSGETPKETSDGDSCETGEGPSEALLERLVAQDWEEGLRNWHEANQEGKTQAPTLREKSSPLEESKHLTQKDEGNKARTSSEAGEPPSSRLVLDVSHGIDQAEKSSAHRINLSCNNFSHQEMLVGHQINHARGTSSTALNCGQNVTEESRAADKRFHKEEKVCKCPDCGKTFSGESDLSQHWITRAGENWKTGINWHQKDHTREKRYRSFDGDEGFNQSGPRISPETVPSEEKPYQCLECGMTFTLKGNLRRHEKYHTGGKSYQCLECGKSFDRSERLISHWRIHTGEKPYQCCECGKSYHAKEALSRHQRIHARQPPSGEMPNECLTCGKIFRSKCDVVRHQTVHTREKPYMCPDCGKHFSQSGYLATHRRIHTGETPHQCVECGKSFRRRDILILHQRIHTGEKPYKCSECGKSFRRADVLFSHQKLHRGEKPFACFECGKTFSQGSSLTSHHKIHTTKRPLKSMERVKIEGINT